MGLQVREDVDELLRSEGIVVHQSDDDERLQWLLSVCQSTQVQLPACCVYGHSYSVIRKM